MFDAKRVLSTIYEDAVENARGAASAVRRVVWDGRDERIIWDVREFFWGGINYVRITRTVGKAYVAGLCSEGTLARA